MFVAKIQAPARLLRFNSYAEADTFATELHEATGQVVEWILPTREPHEIFWTRQRFEEALLRGRFPEPYVICIHEPTQRAYCLNRGYVQICNLFMLSGVPHKPVEVEKRHKQPTAPAWTDSLPEKEFTTYWMY